MKLYRFPSRFTRLLTSFGAALAAVAVLASPVQASQNPAAVRLAGYPVVRQQRALTCEAAATSMATQGILSESSIMARMPENIDPNLGFRGNPDGPYVVDGLPNYGVYPDAVAKDLTTYGWNAKPLYGASRYGLERYLSFGWPVVVWITLDLSYQSPYWKTQHGHRFLLVPEEHAVTAVGYNARDIVVHDPYSGAVSSYSWTDFMRSWGYLDHMALAVQPCRRPAPIRHIHSVRAYWTILWQWDAEPHVAGYGVWIYKRVDGRWRQIKHVITKGTEFEARGTDIGSGYLIRVEGMAPCGRSGTAQYGYSSAR